MATQTTMMNNPLRNAMAAQGGGRSPGGHTSPSAGPPGMTRHRAPAKPPAQSGQGSVIVHLGGAPSATPSNQPPPPPPLSSAPAYIFAAAPPARDEHVKGSVRQHTGYVPAYKRDKYALATPKQEDSPYMAFQDKLIRNGFIRKVFGILVVQLALTIGGVALMMSSRRLIDYVQGSPALFWSAWGVTIIVLSALLCCEDLRRRYPLNYILLFVFTMCETFLIGIVSSFFDTTALVYMLAAVAVVSLGLIAFACQTKVDFGMCVGVLLVISIVCLLFGASAVMAPSETGRFAFAAFGAIMFSCFIVFDIQAVVGGKHRKYQLGPDDYVFAALNLYLDIVSLFVVMLLFCVGKDGQTA